MPYAKGVSLGCLEPAVLPSQGSCLAGGGKFALMGTTMAPGFELSDYEPGVRAVLIRDYPPFKKIIERLTAS